tara:strand:- start:15 stop:164 length:150 start_codon:yes stop_codon:yes gene_type:complete
MGTVAARLQLDKAVFQLRQVSASGLNLGNLFGHQGVDIVARRVWMIGQA